MATVVCIVIVSLLISSVRLHPPHPPDSILFPEDDLRGNYTRNWENKFQFCPNPSALETHHDQCDQADWCFLDLGIGSPIGQALIGELQNNGKFKWRCAGAFIAPQFVLTSAHCMFDLDSVSHVRITVSDSESPSIRDTDMPINRTILHPQYQARKLYYDLAIVQLSRAVWEFQPAFLPTTAVENERFLLSGWSKSKNRHEELMFVSDPVNMIFNEKCSTYFRLPEVTNGIRTNQICGHLPDRSSLLPCSGSLLGSLETQFNLVVGIPSFTFGCGNQRPLVFTNIVYFSPWIRTVIESNWQGHCGFPNER